MSNIVAHDAAATVAAGGIIPLALAGKLPEDQRTSPVTARTYAHPALDGKVIVRIEPEAVAAGTDAEMAAFGFEAPKVSSKLGAVRHRTLGFPAWALVHEPKKAKVALDVVEDVRKAKRMAATKIGHAKDAFEKIAKTLQRQAPSFLPSFWEEGGRVVADQGSVTIAAQFFEKARAAERAYKLKTDPEDSDAVFVEFALLGALSAKTLSTYAKDLAKTAGGKEAYRRFRAIIVKRALGGMPPYSGMGKDLQALAKAAALDQAAEEDALAGELIEAPGVAKAPIEFWTTYNDAIVRLAKARPEVRGRLRAIWPDPRGGNDEKREEFKRTWLEMLHGVGALADLPEEGLGAWVSKMFRYVGKTDRSVAVLRAEAARIARTNQKVEVLEPGRWSPDLHLDLAELVLELGCELADPRRWDDFSRDSITCDPVRVAQHPKYGKKLVEVTANMMGDSDHEHRMRDKVGFAAARRRWIEERLAGLDGKPLLDVEDNLDTLEKKTSAETFLAFPDLHERFVKASLAASLAAQLRGGIPDEFAWPAYEKAFADLGEGVRLGGAFPTLTAWTKTKAIAIDGSGVIAEHDLVYKPKEHKIDHVWYFDGQFLVVLEPEDYGQTVAYWSAKPKDRVDLKQHFRHYGNQPLSWTLPDGSVTLGNKAFRAGDTVLSDSRWFLTDGKEMWIEDNDKLFAFDPLTGKRAALSSPQFIADIAAEGWEVNYGHCQLAPAPAGTEQSPLGQRDGLLGLRVRTKKVEKVVRANDDDDDDDDDDQVVDSERIDGVRGARRYFGLCVFPGDTSPRLLDPDNVYRGGRFGDDGGCGVEIRTNPDCDKLMVANEHDWATRGWTAHVPPVIFWHYLTPRDANGSAALRAITTDAARTILDAARGEVKEIGGDERGRALPKTEAAIRAALPAVTNDALVTGIAGIAEYAGELANKLADAAEMRSKQFADPGGKGLIGDAALVRKLCNALAAGKKTKLGDFDFDPRPWLIAGRARAALSMSPLADADERRKARDVARAFAGTILADDLSRVRILELEAPEDYDSDDWNVITIEPIEGSIFAIETNENWAIELSTDGTFRIPPPWKIEKETRLSRGLGTQWADAFSELPDECVAFDAGIPAKIAERSGLSITEATLLWVGMPRGWNKDFLGKPKRELLGGLKVGDVDAAKTTFEDLDDDDKHALFQLGVPENPQLIRTPLAPGGLAEKLGDAWKQKYGKRAKIPQDLVAGAKKELSLDREIGALLPVFAGSDDVWFFKPDLRPLAELGGWRDENGFTLEKGKELATLASWLFLARPIGDPIRAGIPAVIRKIREILSDSRVVVKFGDSLYMRDYSGKDEKEKQQDEARAKMVMDLVGGKPTTQPKDDDEECEDARDDGAVIAARYKTRIYGGYRPSKLESARKKMEQLAAALRTDDEDTTDPSEPFKIVALLKSAAFAAFAERVDDTPVPEGGYEANPLVSAPKLVAKVAKAQGISDEAAALFLQTLALPEPTQQKVNLWNGWKPKQYATAAAELVKKKLVVEGKRERFGRTIFVKGGYTKGDRTNLPIEEWKLSFFGILDRNIPTEPCHLLFARAYKRFEDGDKP